jgi:hypothetical protein
LLPNKNLNITIVASGDNPVEGIGHFTMHDDTNNSWRFLKKPKFVNGHYCNKNYVGAIYDPYTSSWEYGFTTPPKGTWFDVLVAVYWNCYMNTKFENRECTSENIHYRGYVY